MYILERLLATYIVIAVGCCTGVDASPSSLQIARIMLLALALGPNEAW